MHIEYINTPTIDSYQVGNQILASLGCSPRYGHPTLSIDVRGALGLTVWHFSLGFEAK